MLQRLSLRTRIFLIFAGLAGGALAGIGAGLFLGYSRLGTPETLDAFVQGGVVAAFVTLGLVAWVWYLFDLNVARPIDMLAAALRARTHAEIGDDVDVAIARYLGDLAPAATATAAFLQKTRSALAEAVARETLRLGQEKARLESVLADVPVGVLLCSGDHRIFFYNAAAGDALGAGIRLGLDRRLSDYLHEGPVRLAHERLIAAGDKDAATDLMSTTIADARVLATRMRLLLDEGDATPNYVLSFRDVTAETSGRAQMDARLTEAIDRIRRPAANLDMLVSAMPTGSGPLDDALRAETRALSRAVANLAERHDESRLKGWPLPLTRASDLMDGLKARLSTRGIALQTDAAGLLLSCNGYDILAVCSGLAGRLVDSGRGADLTAVVSEEDTGAIIRLSWNGDPLPIALLDRWLNEAVEPERSDLRRSDVLVAHATEIWPETHGAGHGALCLPIRHGRREVGRPDPIVRRVTYDFDLLTRLPGAKVAESQLDALTYVVFDTETTGLLPGQGDEIVQIAAVRIVNGRLVEGEVFDTLVNPGRNIPLSSTDVHGITNAMVTNAPDMESVLRSFHHFAQGAILVAHNAPFDMAFLRRHEVKLGLRFDHPVLDTVLLSAVVFGQHEQHSLDALTHRLGITIPEEMRHTAIGDAQATAEAFLRLIAVLKGRSLTTFAEVLSEVRKHGRLLADLNTDETLRG